MRRSSLEQLIRAAASVTGEEVAHVVAEMSKHWETLKQLDSSILTPSGSATLVWAMKVQGSALTAGSFSASAHAIEDPNKKGSTPKPGD
jgi:hypothetical protein